MSFVASKVVWALLSPLNLALLLALTGISASFFCKKTGRFLVTTGIFLLFLTGITPVGANLLIGLENRYKRPEKLPAIISGIIILGGTFDTQIASARRTATVNDSIERVLEGLRLARENPLAILVFSGGEGRIFEKGQPEAREAVQWLAQTGYDSDRLIFEDQSRNTWENIQFTRDMINPGADDIWILVTSAYHMPRAMKAIEMSGWKGTVIPWPADYRTDGRIRWLPRRLDAAGNIYKTDLAIHEFAGMLYYRLTGNTASR